MPASIHPWFSFTPGTFSIIIAPGPIICEALNTLLTRHQGRVLYLCGNYPQVLPGITADSDRFKVRRALTAYQMLSILEEIEEPLTLFEHDRGLYDDNSDLIIPVGERCRQRAAERGSIVLFALIPDIWLSQIEPYANRVACAITPHKIQTRIKNKVTSKQQTLDIRS